MVAQAYRRSTQTEAGGLPLAQGQPGYVLSSRLAKATLDQPTEQATNPPTQTTDRNPGCQAWWHMLSSKHFGDMTE